MNHNTIIHIIKYLNYLSTLRLKLVSQNFNKLISQNIINKKKKILLKKIYEIYLPVIEKYKDGYIEEYSSNKIVMEIFDINIIINDIKIEYLYIYRFITDTYSYYTYQCKIDNIYYIDYYFFKIIFFNIYSIYISDGLLIIKNISKIIDNNIKIKIKDFCKLLNLKIHDFLLIIELLNKYFIFNIIEIINDLNYFEKKYYEISRKIIFTPKFLIK